VEVTDSDRRVEGMVEAVRHWLSGCETIREDVMGERFEANQSAEGVFGDSVCREAIKSDEALFRKRGSRQA